MIFIFRYSPNMLVFLLCLLGLNGLVHGANQTSLTTKESPKPLHLIDELILNSLRVKQAEKCEYGEDPVISDLCNHGDSTSYDLKNLRLKNIENMIIRQSVVAKLKQTCKPGEWCFNKKEISKHPIGKSLLDKHAGQMCMFASCYPQMKGYIGNCVKSELSRSVLSLAPVFCEMNMKQTNDYCLEPALELIHVSIASLGNVVNGTLDNVNLYTFYLSLNCKLLIGI